MSDPQFIDRVMETSSTTGTGDYELGGSAEGPAAAYVYYDPSYGLQYSGADEGIAIRDFQDQALAGFGDAGAVEDDQLRVTFTVRSSTIVIKFNTPPD